MSLPEKPIPSRPDDNRSGDSGRGDGWSLRIATIHGIPIRLHFTFLLLLTYFVVAGWGHGGLAQAGFVVGVFFCVVLHELGHSLVAQRYGYSVRDIVLYPIGGVASIEGTPEPRHELWIAVAGPAVNVVIAALLTIWITITTHAANLDGVITQLTGIVNGNRAAVDSGYLPLLLWANIMLVVFNLIPAFPMDGGRVLRAALALKIGRFRATRIAATIGQAIAFLFGIAGLTLPNYMLVIVALFVYFGAGQERQAEESHDIVENVPISDAMMRDFVILSHGDTLKHAADVLLAGSQQDFPVMAGTEIVGMLSRSALLRGLARDGENAFVATYMAREVTFARPEDLLEDYLLSSGSLQHTPVLVRAEETSDVIGMVTLENAMEFLTLRQISRLRASSDTPTRN